MNRSLLEAILFIKGTDGIELNELKNKFKLDSIETVKSEIKELNQKYENDKDSCFNIKIFGSNAFLVTKNNINDELLKLNTVTKNKNVISSSLLEVLTIIAYNPKITNSKIEHIRGISSDHHVKKLVELELVENLGRSDSVGNPYMYKVSDKFFNMIGIKNNSSLPKIDFDFNNEVDEVNLFDSNREE
jgi:segregation and condensation protein B